MSLEVKWISNLINSYFICLTISVPVWMNRNLFPSPNRESWCFNKFPDLSQFICVGPLNWRRGKVPLKKDFITLPKIYIFHVSRRLPQRLMTFHYGYCTLGEKKKSDFSVITLQWLSINTNSKRPKPSLWSTRVKVYSAQITTEVLPQVHFKVSIVGAKTYFMDIFPVLECLIGIDILSNW